MKIAEPPFCLFSGKSVLIRIPRAWNFNVITGSPNQVDYSNFGALAVALSHTSVRGNPPIFSQIFHRRRWGSLRNARRRPENSRSRWEYVECTSRNARGLRRFLRERGISPISFFLKPTRNYPVTRRFSALQHLPFSITARLFGWYQLPAMKAWEAPDPRAFQRRNFLDSRLDSRFCCRHRQRRIGR